MNAIKQRHSLLILYVRVSRVLAVAAVMLTSESSALSLRSRSVTVLLSSNMSAILYPDFRRKRLPLKVSLTTFILNRVVYVLGQVNVVALRLRVYVGTLRGKKVVGGGGVRGRGGGGGREEGRRGGGRGDAPHVLCLAATAGRPIFPGCWCIGGGRGGVAQLSCLSMSLGRSTFFSPL